VRLLNGTNNLPTKNRLNAFLVAGYPLQKAWTPSTKQQLRHLAAQNTPTRVIELKLGRTPASVYSQAAKQGTSLEPHNQRPYGTKNQERQSNIAARVLRSARRLFTSFSKKYKSKLGHYPLPHVPCAFSETAKVIDANSTERNRNTLRK
jgi:hypothetical protein